MLMFLTILCASIPVLLFCCLAAAGAGRPKEEPSRAQPEAKTAPSSSRFFAGDASRMPGSSALPVELMLSQIESHVRLEQAAAESFLSVPTPDALHSRSASPFLN